MGIQIPKGVELDPPDPLTASKSCRINTNSDPHHAAALSARAKKTTARIAAAKAEAEIRDRDDAEKEAKYLAKKQEGKDKRAEAEVEAQERNRKRAVAETEQTKRKAREKREGKEAREERRRRDERRRQEAEDEKRRKMHLESVAWGLDDRAGKRSCISSEDSDGCYISDGRAEMDDAEPPLSKRIMHQYYHYQKTLCLSGPQSSSFQRVNSVVQNRCLSSIWRSQRRHQSPLPGTG